MQKCVRLGGGLGRGGAQRLGKSLLGGRGPGALWTLLARPLKRGVCEGQAGGRRPEQDWQPGAPLAPTASLCLKPPPSLPQPSPARTAPPPPQAMALKVVAWMLGLLALTGEQRRPPGCLPPPPACHRAWHSPEALLWRNAREGAWPEGLHWPPGCLTTPHEGGKGPGWKWVPACSGTRRASRRAQALLGSRGAEEAGCPLPARRASQGSAARAHGPSGQPLCWVRVTPWQLQPQGSPLGGGGRGECLWGSPGGGGWAAAGPP